MFRSALALSMGWLVLYWRIDCVDTWYHYFTYTPYPKHYTTLEDPMQVLLEVVGAFVLLAVLFFGFRAIDAFFDNVQPNKSGENK